MAKAKTKAPDAPTVRARVLVAVESFGLKVGQVFEAEPGVIDGLVSTGEVDSHPDAVAYALAQGGEVVTQACDPANAASAAAAPTVGAAASAGEGDDTTAALFGASDATAAAV